jgi:hypothetical protein
MTTNVGVACERCGVVTFPPSCIACGADVTVAASAPAKPESRLRARERSGTDLFPLSATAPTSTSAGGRDRTATSATTHPAPRSFGTARVLAALTLLVAGVVLGTALTRGGDDGVGTTAVADGGGDSTVQPAATSGATTESPTATSKGATSTGASPPPATSPSRPDLAMFEGRDFAIGYPIGWVVEKGEVVPAGTNYLDTTIKPANLDPHYVVRVDVLRDRSPQQVAESIIADLRVKRGFRQLDFRDTTITTVGGVRRSAILVEFLLDHPDSGWSLHSVDVIFSDGGRTVALLTRAPAQEWSSYAQMYESVRESIEMR